MDVWWGRGMPCIVLDQIPDTHLQSGRCNRSNFYRVSRRQNRGGYKLERSSTAHCFQARIKGSFLEMAAVSPLGTPTIIGATALNSAGMPSFAFTPGVFSAATEEPMTQLPNPMAQAASIRFSAASQQSASTKGPDGLAQMTMSVPASWKILKSGLEKVSSAWPPVWWGRCNLSMKNGLARSDNCFNTCLFCTTTNVQGFHVRPWALARQFPAMLERCGGQAHPAHKRIRNAAQEWFQICLLLLAFR